MRRPELLERIRKAVDAEPLDPGTATEIACRVEREPAELLRPLLEAARELGLRGHGSSVTVSLNVFIPLTNLCRNRCAYCTFAKPFWDSNDDIKARNNPDGIFYYDRNRKSYY